MMVRAQLRELRLELRNHEARIRRIAGGGLGRGLGLCEKARGPG